LIHWLSPDDLTYTDLATRPSRGEVRAFALQDWGRSATPRRTAVGVEEAIFDLTGR
jgi:hypothetical protein